MTKQKEEQTPEQIDRELKLKMAFAEDNITFWKWMKEQWKHMSEKNLNGDLKKIQDEQEKTRTSKEQAGIPA